MAATQTQVLEPEVAGPEGLPDQNHIAPDPRTSDERDEEQAREAAKLRPEREAKLSDYYVSFLLHIQQQRFPPLRHQSNYFHHTGE